VTDIVAGMALGVVMGYYVVGFIPTEMFQWIFFFIFFTNENIVHLFFNLR
jgi:uncharacterized membrane protein YfcA